jgi:hypothetical protein
MIKILYFAPVIFSEVKRLRNLPTVRNREVLRCAQNDKINWVKTNTGGGQLCRLPVKLGPRSG